MGVSKVDFAGNTLVDLTGDSVTPATLKKGETAHNAAGEQIVGTMEAGGGTTPGTELKIVVSVTSGATVTATKGSLSVSGTAVAGTCTLIVPEAGTWSVKATHNGQTSDTKSVTFTDSYTTSLSFFSATITVTVDSGATVVLKKGDVTLQTKTSTGTVVFTVTEMGIYTVEATKDGKTVSGSVNVVSGTTSYSLTLTFVSSALNDTEWDVIKSVSDAGQGANYWSIGDRKAVAVSGTVGTQSVNGTYYAYIIGFNHNSSKEGNGITFGTFKTALSGGTDICLVDGKYDGDSTNGTKYFNMDHSSNTNSGGWKGCDLRYDVLGSTNTNDGDATATTATNPVANTLMAALPSDLRAVMQPMTIYTDNTGGGSDNASYVTKTTDYLPLLAEYEIFGTRIYANSAEKNYQAQYAYYSAGNSKVKYRHSATGSTAWWWERSPYYNGSYAFCGVNTNDNADMSDARFSSGVAPAFRV